MTETIQDSKIKTITGRPIPLPGNDIDTDRIIPARFMKCVTFADLGQYAFYDARFNPDGSKKDHPFNEEKYKGGTILLVGRNFGCGSSREHAPQSLLKYGIRAVVGESFAEIFAGNCSAIGLPAVTAAKTDLDNLFRFSQQEPQTNLKIDLEAKKLSYGNSTVPIALPEQARMAFVNGTWDTTAELLTVLDKVKQVAKNLPYLNGFVN